MKYYILSCSWGKDSTALLLKIIELRLPLNEVIFYDTGMEFQAIYNVRNKLLPLLKEKEIKYTELKDNKSFEYKMFKIPIKKRGTNDIHKYGYSWCGGNVRWETTCKKKIIENYYKNNLMKYEVIEYIGIAYDEQDRIKDKVYPLIDLKMKEKDCLDYCYSKGIYWEEYDEVSKQTFRLYDYLSRVSCWCCRNKNLDELRNYYHYMPMYWNKLKEIQTKLPNDSIKKQSGSVFNLEKRFMLEDEWIKQGKVDKLKSKEFFKQLKNRY